ncbi:MAG: hypothetical protein AAFP84_07270 [Actinomycetota bacterium]
MSATAPTRNGYVQLYPCNSGRPSTSALNFRAGQNISNFLIIDADGDREICAYAHVSGGSVIVTVQRQGYIAQSANAAAFGGADYVADGQRRLVSNRSVGAGSTTVVRGLQPLSAPILNVTAVQPQTNGYAVAYGCADGRPYASSSNYVAGDVKAAGMVVHADHNGEVCIYTTSAMRLYVDYFGGFSIDPPYAHRAQQMFFKAHRVLDSRNYSSSPARTSFQIHVPEARGRAVYLTAAIVAPSRSADLYAFPCGGSAGAPDMRIEPGRVNSNALVVLPNSSNRICFSLYPASAKLIVDVSGFLNQHPDYSDPRDPECTHSVGAEEFPRRGQISASMTSDCRGVAQAKIETRLSLRQCEGYSWSRCRAPYLDAARDWLDVNGSNYYVSGGSKRTTRTWTRTCYGTSRCNQAPSWSTAETASLYWASTYVQYYRTRTSQIPEYQRVLVGVARLGDHRYVRWT